MTNARPPSPDPAGGEEDANETAAAAREGFFRRFLRLAGGYYTSEEKWSAWGLTIGVLALTLLQIGVQVRFNLWNRDFFDALENRDRAAFFGQMGLFVGLALASMVTAVFQLYVRQLLQLNWRRWLVFHLQQRWLEGSRHYQLNFLPGAADNPDQRISENTRHATAMAVDMAVGLVTSVLMLVSFVGILWTLSGPLHVALGANEFEKIRCVHVVGPIARRDAPDVCDPPRVGVGQGPHQHGVHDAEDRRVRTDA